ncbi:MAG TPA: HAMP domain-containing sensor histidine kinase [Oligoflexia bacterium]|nr:HAMP domain-containing sensor histidine kinase [Oligoflexia bacterium]
MKAWFNSVQRIRKWASGRPVFWSALAFFVVVTIAVTLSVWWNLLLVEKHQILQRIDNMAQLMADRHEQERVPLALLMFVGIGLSVIAILALVFLFLRLIQTLRLNLAQSQFIAAVTHELRSPVAGIQILFDTLSRGDLPPGKKLEFEASIRKELKRLQDLVDQVLDTATLEHGITKFQMQSLRLNALIHETVEPLATVAASLGGSITCNFNGDPTVYANRKLLSTALSNILDNAIKYARGIPEITLRTRQTHGWVEIAVEDRGIGLAHGEQRKIFKRFFRAQDARIQAKTGTGLGLYFCKLALSAQGAKISAKSAGPNRGTTFSIRLRAPKEARLNP